MFKGFLARRLIVSIVGLSLVGALVAIGAVWAVYITDQALTEVMARSDRSRLSARLHSEVLTLTDMMRRYVFQLPGEDSDAMLEQINEQEALLDGLMQDMSAGVGPDDMEERQQIDTIRSLLGNFLIQPDKIVEVFEKEERLVGPRTQAELNRLEFSFQDPLLNALKALEDADMQRASQERQRANQVVQTLLVILLLVVLGVVLVSLGMTQQVVQRFVQPLAALRQGVEQMRGGQLDHPMGVLGKDELGELAQAFNTLSADLQDSRRQLELHAHNLEVQVADRTREAEQRALQTQTAAEVAQAAVGTLDLEELLQLSVNLIRSRFDLYYVGLFLVDDVVCVVRLRAATGQAGQRMLRDGHSLPLDETSMTGWSILHGEPRLAPNVDEEPTHFKNPWLPETRSEVTLPLITRGLVIGALTVQSRQLAAFKDSDITILQTMAGQLANAIGNARLYQEIQKEKLAVEDANRQLEARLKELSKAQDSEREQRLLAESLVDIIMALNSSLDYNEVLDLLLVNIAHVVPHENSNIALLDEGGQVHILRVRGYQLSGGRDALFQKPLFLEDYPVWRRAVATLRPQVISDVAHMPDWVPVPGLEWIRSTVCAPIVSKGIAIGFLNVDSPTPYSFSTVHASRFQIFADQAAVAIERARLFEQIQCLVITDELTGAANRRQILNLAQQEFERFQRYNHPLSALMIDLDHFKQANDTFGHPSGDQALIALTRCCRESLRSTDFFGRYGGEEFLALLPETDQEQAFPVAERLRQQVESLSIPTNRGSLHITISIGVATLAPGSQHDLDWLIVKADDALYVAKAAGRNRVMRAEIS